MEDRRIPEEKSERAIFPRLFLLILGGVIAAGRLSPNPEYRPPSPETLDIMLKGDDLGRSFYGQPVPGAKPILFAPEVLTEELGAHGRLSFSPDGREIFLSSREKIYFSVFDGKSLSPPNIAPFVDSSRHDGPVFSRDGRTVYFTSMRGLPIEKNKPNGRLWAVGRNASGWGEPYLLSDKIDRVTSQISLADRGRLYFTRLVDRERTYFVSRLIDDRLADAEPVRFAGSAGIQLDDLYIDPQERFLIGSIVRSNRASYRMADLVICFKQDDGAWGEPRLLNDKINTVRYERFPGLSPDGRFLFFVRSSEPGSFKGARYYWVATESLGIPGFQPAHHKRDEWAGGAELFFGQAPPGLEPKKFGSDILTDGKHPHSQLAFAPDGTDIYWSAFQEGSGQKIFHSVFDGKFLSWPEVAPFATASANAGPAFSPDGKRLFFSAELTAEKDPAARPTVILYVEKTGLGWSRPGPIEATVGTRMTKGQMSVARGGNIYFSGRFPEERWPAIFLVRHEDGRYLSPVKLGGPLATVPLLLDPWVDPDERFLLVSFPRQEGSPTLTDIGICFRQPDGSWSLPVRLGGAVNTEAFERFPSLSPDGKYLFFIRSFGREFASDQAYFYWVDARVIGQVTQKESEDRRTAQ